MKRTACSSCPVTQTGINIITGQGSSGTAKWGENKAKYCLGLDVKLSSNWTPSYQTSLVPYYIPPVNVSTVHICKWSTSTETSRSLMATTVSEILIYENLITHLGSEKRTEHIWRYGEALQTDRSFRELQALAVDSKRGPQRDPSVKSSSDCLTRWEKQDKRSKWTR